MVMFEKGERGLTELRVGIWHLNVVQGRDPYATIKAYPDVEVIAVVVVAAGRQAVDLLHFSMNPLYNIMCTAKV